MDFIIDTVGDEELLDKDEIIGEIDENEFAHANPDELSEALESITILLNKINTDEKKRIESQRKKSDNKTDEMIDKFFIDMGWGPKIGTQTFTEKLIRTKNRFNFDNIDFETGILDVSSAVVNIEKQMEKSVLKPGLEKEVSLPEYSISDKRLKAIRKREREKTKGPSWYNMPAPEITEEIKNDLEVLKMRSALDPKHFYKKNDMEVLPKYFQIGKIMDSPLDHQNMKLTKKERKRTIVDELLADANFNKYNKKKYKEILEEKRKTTYKTYIKDKRKKSKLAFNQKKKENKLKKIQKGKISKR